MPAPLYGADDPRRCSGNSVSEVLDKFRKNYDLIMSLPQETKEEKEFRHCIWLAEKEERERIYQTSIRPFRKATYPIPYLSAGAEVPWLDAHNCATIYQLTPHAPTYC